MKRRSNTQVATRLLRPERRLNAKGYRCIAGVDEAGRGPLAGPVVAGAVVLGRLPFKTLIDDSKTLSAAQREAAYEEIFRKASVGVGIIDEKTIDRVNIYQATRLAMQRALQNLPHPPDYILVDGTMTLPAACPCEAIVAGDARSLSIAAASIVAKVTRDRIMRAYDLKYPRYGFARHKGYPTLAHRTALRIHGPSPIHRASFRPVMDAVPARPD